MSRINGTGGSEVRRIRMDFKPAEPKTTTATQVKPSTLQVKDGFTATQARGASALTAKTSGAGDLPAEIPTGTKDYYRKRYDDFVRRNPGVTPPDYYLNYGQKYLDRFSKLGPGDLSPAGLAWRDRTLKNLQDAIEKKRAEDPVGFAQLERNPAAFRAFCYGTHPDAYIKGGLFKLPAQDLLKIATTPDLRDLLSKDGLKQVFDVLRQMGPKEVGEIGWKTIQEGLRNFRLPRIDLPTIPLPRLPFRL